MQERTGRNFRRSLCVGTQQIEMSALILVAQVQPIQHLFSGSFLQAARSGRASGRVAARSRIELVTGASLHFRDTGRALSRLGRLCALEHVPPMEAGGAWTALGNLRMGFAQARQIQAFSVPHQQHFRCGLIGLLSAREVVPRPFGRRVQFTHDRVIVES